MAGDRVTMARPNPGIRNANWNKPRDGMQDIQEIAGAREWVEPARTRDDHEGDARVVEKVAPLANAVPDREIMPVIHRPSAEDVGQIIERSVYNPGRLDLTPDPVARCLLCGRKEPECAVLVELHSGHICDQCTEEAIDLVKQELPKRRLRLVMERMLAGQVTPEMVAEIEKMMGVKSG